MHDQDPSLEEREQNTTSPQKGRTAVKLYILGLTQRPIFPVRLENSIFLKNPSLGERECLLLPPAGLHYSADSPIPLYRNLPGLGPGSIAQPEVRHRYNQGHMYSFDLNDCKMLLNFAVVGKKYDPSFDLQIRVSLPTNLVKIRTHYA